MSVILDLEQKILELGSVSGDIKAVYEYISEEVSIPAKENDKISIVLLGIANLYDMKFNRTFETFEALCAEHAQRKKELEAIKCPDLQRMKKEIEAAKVQEVPLDYGCFGGEMY